MKQIVLCILVIVSLLSCTKEEVSNINVPIFGYESVEEARKQLGDYVKLFELTNASMQLQTTKYGNIGKAYARIFGRFQESSNSSRSDGGIFKVEDLILHHDEKFQQYVPQEGNLDPQESYDRIAKYFGSNVNFTVEKDSKIIIDGTYYLPEEIRVNIDGLSSHPSTNAFSIIPQDTRVTWNTDDRNDNGVVVHLTYDGTNINTGGGVDFEDKRERAIKFEDTGEGIIPSEFFEGIPEGGIFTIRFIRGVVDILQDSETGHTFKFYSLTRDKKNLIAIE